MISWTPEGFFGRMLAAIRPYRPALSAAVPPAALWGHEDYAVGLLGDRVTNVYTRRDMLTEVASTAPRTCTTTSRIITAQQSRPSQTSARTAVLAAALDAQLIELAQEFLADGVMGWEYLLLTVAKR